MSCAEFDAERRRARLALAAFTISAARNPHDIEMARELFRRYGETPDVDVCAVGFDSEIAELPGPYIEPHGAILLAKSNSDAIGCVALRPVGNSKAEMKRLFVDPKARGKKVGEALTLAAIEAARSRGYTHLRLDTLPSMGAARLIYTRLGFTRVEPWTSAPLPGALYLERVL